MNDRSEQHSHPGTKAGGGEKGAGRVATWQQSWVRGKGVTEGVGVSPPHLQYHFPIVPTKNNIF
jgi:hypothetical protein